MHALRRPSRRDARRCASSPSVTASLLLEDSAHALGTRIGGEHARHARASPAPTASSRTRISLSARAAWWSAATTTTAARAAAAALARHDHRSPGIATRAMPPSYDVVALGHNYRIDEPRCALGLSRLARLDDDNRRRAALDARYRELLAGATGLTPALAPAGRRDARAPPLHRRARRGRGSRGRSRAAHAAGSPDERPLPAGAPLRDLCAPQAPRYRSRRVCGRTDLTLPLFAHMTEEQVELVAATLREACA